MISTSAVSADRYYWMRYSAERAFKLESDSVTDKVQKGDLFGVRELRGKQQDEVVLAKTGNVFRLDIARSEKLMNASKEFKGKTPTITKVKPAKQKPVETKKRKIHVIDPRESVDDRMKKLLKKYKASLNKLTKTSAAALLEKVAKAEGDATAVQLKHWGIANAESNTLKLALKSIVVGASRQGQSARRGRPPKLSKLTVPAVGDEDEPKVNPMKVDFPEIDDFVDNDVSEFTKYRRFSESRDRAK